MSTRNRYPAGPDEVVAARLDPDYLDTLCRLTGALEHSVDVDQAAGSSQVRRVMPTDHVPDFARRLTGETITVVESTAWDPPGAPGDGRTGTVRLRVEGAPVTSVIALRLVADGDGTLETAEGDITAKVPLVGGRIEKALEPAIRAGLQAQVTAFQRWSQQ